MTVLFAGNEFDAYTLSGSALVMNTSGTFHDSIYTRGAMEVKETSNITGNFVADSTAGWLHFTMGFPLIATDQDQRLVELRDSTANQVVFQIDFDNGFPNLEYWNGSGFTELGGLLLFNNRKITCDLHWSLSTSNGTYQWWVNGGLVTQFIGDNIRPLSYNVINQVRFHSPRNASDAARHPLFSEVVVDTANTFYHRVATIVPNASGASTTWLGSSTDVDDLALSDLNFIESTINDEIELNACTNLSTLRPPGETTILGLAIGVRANQTSTVGPDNVQAALRTGGSDFFGSDIPEPSTLFNGSMTMFETNPIGSSVWTISDIDALEIGVRSRI